MVPILTRDNLLIIGALLLITFLAIRVFNGLIQTRARTREAWAGIEAQLKRRADLVPNLVSALKGYAAHEQQLLDEVAQRRAEVERAPGPATAGEAGPGLRAPPGGPLGRAG